MKQQRGFVLVNALVIVAALAAAAVFMLGRAEEARVRAEVAVEAAQLGLNLDAFETLAKVMLERDSAGGGPADHPGEAWARNLPPVPLERGQVSGQISDLQGRFNINRLANPEDAFAHAAFERLAQRLGLSPQRVEDIRALLSPDGPENTRDYTRAEPPVAPVGGALLMREQLRLIPALSARDYDRLAPHIAVLPPAMTLNVNTASSQVLASLLPNTNAAALDALVQSARRQPFTSVDAFITELLRIAPPDDITELPEGLLGVGSSWFELEIAAELDGRVATRRAVVNRLPLPQPATVAYRLDNWN